VGIPIFYVDIETPETYERDLAALGQLLGNAGGAEEVLGFYRDRLDRVAEATAGLADGDRPSVLLIEYSVEEGTVAFSVPPAGWLQTTLVELAGGEPVWTEAAEGGGWTVVGLEQIAAWDPDQIYVVDYDGNSEEWSRNWPPMPTGRRSPRWRRAVSTASPATSFSWDQPDTRWVLGLEWLFTKVQPDLAAGIDVVSEVQAFYEELYSLDAAPSRRRSSPGSSVACPR